jgi:integrase
MSIPPSVMALLKTYKAHQAQQQLKAGDLWHGSDRLFVTWNGRPMHTYTPGRWFSKFIERHSLPPLTFHGLRHTNATILINEKLPTKSISGRLGHADTSTTLNIYGHYLKSADKEAADRLEEVYQRMVDGGKKDTKKGQA